MRTSIKISIRLALCCLLSLAPIQARTNGAMFFGGNVAPTTSGPSFVAAPTPCAGTSTTGCTTSAANMTGANFCAITVTVFTGISATNITSSPSNTWTQGPAIGVGGTFNSYLFYDYAPTVNSSMTFTITISGGFPVIAPVCFKGTIGSTIDQSNSATGTTVTSVQPGSITPMHNNEIVISAVDPCNATTGPTSAYTSIASVANVGGTSCALGAGYTIQTTATSTNPTWSWTTASSAGSVIGSFQ